MRIFHKNHRFKVHCDFFLLLQCRLLYVSSLKCHPKKSHRHLHSPERSQRFQYQTMHNGAWTTYTILLLESLLKSSNTWTSVVRNNDTSIFSQSISVTLNITNALEWSTRLGLVLLIINNFRTSKRNWISYCEQMKLTQSLLALLLNIGCEVWMLRPILLPEKHSMVLTIKKLPTILLNTKKQLVLLTLKKISMRMMLKKQPTTTLSATMIEVVSFTRPRPSPATMMPMLIQTISMLTPGSSAGKTLLSCSRIISQLSMIWSTNTQNFRLNPISMNWQLYRIFWS